MILPPKENPVTFLASSRAATSSGTCPYDKQDLGHLPLYGGYTWEHAATGLVRDLRKGRSTAPGERACAAYVPSLWPLFRKQEGFLL